MVAVDGGPTVIVLPGPPRELHEMWEPALATTAVQAVLARAEPYRTQTVRLFGMPESEIAQSLREIGADVDLSRLEITTCLRRGELEVDVRHRAGGDEAREALVAGILERHDRFVFSSDGSTIDEQVAELLRAGAGSRSRSRAPPASSRRGSPSRPRPRPISPGASSPIRTRPRPTSSGCRPS